MNSGGADATPIANLGYLSLVLSFADRNPDATRFCTYPARATLSVEEHAPDLRLYQWAILGSNQ